jgi:amidase
MTSLHELSLCEAHDKLRAREFSALELTEHTLQRIEALDPTLRAFATYTPELALEQARRADEDLARGLVHSPVHGIPIGLKDLCGTRGAPTHAGSVACANWNPGVESTVARRLREGGAVLVGKLTTTEGASGVHHPKVTPPVNPWNAGYWTGASSSGSGAATAAGLCFGSLGSDTGGSIRFPSLCCGLVGIKATWGRVSRYGVFPLAASLDHVGPMTRRVKDAAAMLGVIAGRDEADPTTFHAADSPYEAEAGKSLRGLRLGYDEAFCHDGVDERVAKTIEDAVEHAVARGAQRVPIEVPRRAETISAWLTLCAVEAAAAHAPYYPERGEDYGPALTALLDYGLRQTHEQIANAQIDRIAVARDWELFFEQVDVMISPASYDTPPTLEEGRKQMRGDGMRRLLAFTAPADLTGAPTISLPAGLTGDGVPFGYQLVARPREEALLVRAGHALEEDGAWPATIPPLRDPAR